MEKQGLLRRDLGHPDFLQDVAEFTTQVKLIHPQIISLFKPSRCGKGKVKHQEKKRKL
jgi:hypothetical protein